MNLISTRIINLIKTIFSLIRINFYVLYKKIFDRKLKIIFFYFPTKSYQNNLIDLITELNKEKNFKVLLGFNLGSSNEVKYFKDSFFLSLGYLKHIFGIDMFISSYIVYSFPKAKNKIYINHDIYDAPMVSRENESSLVRSFYKYDYIFMSSHITVNMLEKKVDEFYLKNQNLKKPKIINTGYLKLDHVYHLIKNNKEIEDSILLAPTKSNVFPEYDMSLFIKKIVDEILNNKKFKLIYRPHPGDLKDQYQKKKIMDIYNYFKFNSDFTLDINASYLKSYKKAKILITDFSGTAYTYAFCKLKPVIFFSKNEKNLINSNLANLYYFKDREEIGTIESNIENMNNTIDFVDKKIESFSININTLRYNRIEYFDNSMKQNLFNIKKILNYEQNN